MLNLSWGWGHDDGNGNKKMYAAFNELTKSGKIKAKHCEEFFYKNGLLRLNGQEYHVETPIDLYADQNQLMAWFKKITAKGQIDMFAELEPPTAKKAECDLIVFSMGHFLDSNNFFIDQKRKVVNLDNDSLLKNFIFEKKLPNKY